MNPDTKNNNVLPDVAFVTVNYNTKRLLVDLVEFFKATTFPFRYTLTVVDNASTDDSLDYLESCHNVCLVKNLENIGYGRAMNRGIAASRGKYVCAMNTDLVLNKEALIAVWDHLESHKETGVVSPAICYPGGRIQGFVFYGWKWLLYSNLLCKVTAKFLKVRIEFGKRPFRVDGVLGAFIFLRRDICLDGMLFDEDFFFYFEDTDLAHRLMKRGVRCDVLPTNRIVHLGGQSTNIRNSIQYYRSKYMYAEKHYGREFTYKLIDLDARRIRRKIRIYFLLGKICPIASLVKKFALYSSVGSMFQSLSSDLKK